MPQLQQILAFPAAYRLLGRLLGRDARTVYVRDYLQAQPGERVLDLGCGPADILTHLPPCEYVGIDMDAAYVEAARARFGSRGTFACVPVEEYAVTQPASFDLVMANGVLHHLDDRQATALLTAAARALKPGGRLVTLDGCYVPRQSWVARTLLRMDRGQFIRNEASYQTLAFGCFTQIACSVRHDLLNLPYTHLIMTCRRPRAF
ncbi:MAG: class I SAM-dependent methyltransferase [Gemmataceae bacterium]